MTKAKIMRFVKKHINRDTIQFFVLLIPILILLINQLLSNSFNLGTFLDTTVLTALVLAFLCELLARTISEFVMRKCEDAYKLTENYEMLCKKYCKEELLQYDNISFPIICLCIRKIKEPLFNIEIDNEKSHESYRLPTQIQNCSDYLMKAHKKSTLYNQIHIRINDIVICGNHITLKNSRTTYFDSMITNRAMDYELQNGKTIREIYEPGPFLSCLSESKLSNHLGFNGFVETSDNRIIFVKRSQNVSIGKETLADSIGASLKVKYCFNSNRELTEDGLYNTIVKEIDDELKINSIKPDDVRNSIFAFYRDLVEGGKPQFLFYFKLNNMTVKQFEENFRNSTPKKKLKKDRKNGIIDGNKFYYYSVQELKDSIILPGKLITPDGTHHKMMPSASGSIVMLLKHLK